MKTYYIFIGLFVVVTLWTTWRLYSKRDKLPCPAYLAWMVELDNPFAKAHKANEIINALPLQKGINVLDVGCGPGRVSIPLAEKIASLNGHVTGLDVNGEMLQRSKNKAQKLNISNIEFILGDIDQVPLDHSYGVIVMVCVLGEIPEAQHDLVLNKLASHLNSEGIISITETIFDPHYQSRHKVIQLMNKAGFIETKFMGNWLAYTSQFKKEEH